MRPNEIICGTYPEVTQLWPENCVDLVFSSPPYEDARTYGMDFNLKGQEWVDWMVKVYKESLRICKGLVAFVVQGRTRNYRWSCVPALLIADLHRAGICVREGPYFHRIGIPGSGGPDWLRHDLEYIVSVTSGGKLPWSDNTACGHPCKYRTGGPMSNRTADGRRSNASRSYDKSPHTKRMPDGTMRLQGYTKPDQANPGNVIKCKVGGGNIGNKLAHENEASFPEQLADFMLRSFCPPDGIVLDPFSGSGTTAAVAVKTGRKYIAIDIRQSQCDLTKARVAEAETGLTVAEQKTGQKGLF